jgi:capsular polysaccharide biosynthesis protein
MLPPEYSSRVTLLVGPPLAGEAATLNDVLVGRALLPTYAQLAVTRPLLQRAIDSTAVDDTPDELSPRVSTVVPSEQSVLEVEVSYGDPADAAALANAIADELVDYSRAQVPLAESGSISLAVIDPAVEPTEPESPRAPTNAALGALIGMVATLGVGFLVENLREDESL